uniref:Armadillo-like helical domain-containing protein 4 n=1 Tax=Erpetoichthys calabaricus TaxID=27687 RepID=A0A8C4XGL2_ERPCA
MDLGTASPDTSESSYVDQRAPSSETMEASELNLSTPSPETPETTPKENLSLSPSKISSLGQEEDVDFQPPVRFSSPSSLPPSSETTFFSKDPEKSYETSILPTVSILVADTIPASIQPRLSWISTTHSETGDTQTSNKTASVSMQTHHPVISSSRHSGSLVSRLRPPPETGLEDLEKLESEEEHDSEERDEEEEEEEAEDTPESDEDESQEDDLEMFAVTLVTASLSQTPYHLPAGNDWAQRNQGLVQSLVEKIRDKAGYVSSMLAPVGIGIAGALFILGALYSIKVIHRKRKSSFKRQRRKHREMSTRQDRVMLLADSSEDEF